MSYTVPTNDSKEKKLNIADKTHPSNRNHKDSILDPKILSQESKKQTKNRI